MIRGQTSSVAEKNGANPSEAWLDPHADSRVPELLAPAGDWACAKAAAENGADAIYFGLEKFNARMLARECSIKEIEQIRRGPRIEGREPEDAGAALPLEVFVHGALCVAYSGQCLTSESLGGRSANRGECAQACRMPYELVCDGQPVP